MPIAADPRVADKPGGLCPKLARFVAVGGTATALHYLITAVLTLPGWAPLVVASTIGFLVSALANYALNARFTFSARAGDAAQSLRFAVTVAGGCALNAALLKIAVALGLHPAAAQVLATLLVLAWNFALSSCWVFRSTVPAHPANPANPESSESP